MRLLIVWSSSIQTTAYYLEEGESIPLSPDRVVADSLPQAGYGPGWIVLCVILLHTIYNVVVEHKSISTAQQINIYR